MKKRDSGSGLDGNEIEAVRLRISSQGLQLREVARRIGITLESLTRHLGGEYVRSDSLAKYRQWLNRHASRSFQLELLNEPIRVSPRPSSTSAEFPASLVIERRKPQRHHLVVDLFSGGGGMSLGFELLDSGSVFKTVLAIDVEEPMVRVFNANHDLEGQQGPIAVQADLSDFVNEAEILAFYLANLACQPGFGDLGAELQALPVMGLSQFIKHIVLIDKAFLKSLERIRSSDACKRSYQTLTPSSLSQTSVIGFHSSLGLPQMSSARLQLPPIIWTTPRSVIKTSELSDDALIDTFIADTDLKRRLDKRWDTEFERLRSRTAGTGRGQLASSARRIQSFLSLLGSPAWREIRLEWVSWMAKRQCIREFMFNDETRAALEALYQAPGRKVSVLLGGPPCQGFSRIGRGKIRSLRDQQVHVHVDSQTGDSRNRLMHSYVLFVSALAPDMFLFENVRHFQTEVLTPAGSFSATEVLSDAIAQVSTSDVRYSVAKRIIDASKHSIPSKRERYFMVGVASTVGRVSPEGVDLAEWCLNLREADTIPLRVALEGLPTPSAVTASRMEGLDREVAVASAVAYSDNEERFRSWLRQGSPASRDSVSTKTDAHHIRSARTDDAEFFALLGPGMRWMDYRCDSSQTLASLRSLMGKLKKCVQEAKSRKLRKGSLEQKLTEIDEDVLSGMIDRLDGSLSIRLLLEQLDTLPGELQHHLLASGYLGKREGNHGDWMARLHPNRPSKTIVSHMSKDSYAYIHPYEPRSISVREAARIQSFPDWFRFGSLGLVEAFKIIGNAVPPLLSYQLAERVAQVLQLASQSTEDKPGIGESVNHEAVS